MGRQLRYPLLSPLQPWPSIAVIVKTQKTKKKDNPPPETHFRYRFEGRRTRRILFLAGLATSYSSTRPGTSTHFGCICHQRPSFCDAAGHLYASSFLPMKCSIQCTTGSVCSKTTCHRRKTTCKCPFYGPYYVNRISTGSSYVPKGVALRVTWLLLLTAVLCSLLSSQTDEANFMPLYSLGK